MKLELGQIVDGNTRNYFNGLEEENAGLREYADSRDQSIAVYRQQIAELKKHFETALSLIDGAMVIVELSALESPAQKEWRDNWLKQAREAMDYSEPEKQNK